MALETASETFSARDDILSWGRVDRRRQQVARPHFRDQLSDLIERKTPTSRLAVGLRRSYGDSCLNSCGALIDMTDLSRFIEFDPVSGVLRAEAGVSLSRILMLVVPHGWFLPTTPGTRFVTLGGAVANDVHGKNHHRSGSFGRHVNALGLLRSDGFRNRISPGSNPELFAATIGGLGLTGAIEWVELKLQPIGSAYLDVETIPFHSLDEFWAIGPESSANFEHTVSWIDCTSRGAHFGRGILSRANWSDDRIFTPHPERDRFGVPFDVPSFVLNRHSVSAFNEVYFRWEKTKASRRREHYLSFFYPLDGLSGWNRLYGRRGMYQYQCVVPPAAAPAAMSALLDEITSSGQASFLAVLKTFGELVSPGMLSFPRPGTTLALDLPNRGDASLRLFSRLDRIVEEAGGALYPAKDGRMPAQMFQRSFPRWREFVQYKDPEASSDFFLRVAA